MSAEYENITRLIYRCIDEMNEQLPEESQLAKNSATVLVGGQGGLDSLGFITFIGLVEEKCEDEFSLTLALADAAASAEGDEAFETVGALATVIEKRVAAPKN